LLLISRAGLELNDFSIRAACDSEEPKQHVHRSEYNLTDINTVNGGQFIKLTLYALVKYTKGKNYLQFSYLRMAPMECRNMEEERTSFIVPKSSQFIFSTFVS
jgi:hypothetical protein